MRWLIDENVRKEVREFLKSIGHNVAVAPPGSSDEEIAHIAKTTPHQLDKRLVILEKDGFRIR